MKQLLLALLLLASASICRAVGPLPHRLYAIAIRDSAYVPVVTSVGGSTTVTLTFGFSALNTIVSGATIYSFEQAYPTADSRFLQQIYYLETTDSTIAYQLRQYDSIAFYYVREQANAQYCRTPSDYAHDIPSQVQSELEWINAKLAWNTSIGDSATIIGMTDVNFQPSHPEFNRTFGKFYKVRDSVQHGSSTPGLDTNHGMQVAGLIACGTDDGLGLAAIGWNCRLDVSSKYGVWGGLSEMIKMSQDGDKVINGSWVSTGVYPSLTPPYEPSITDELLTNECYENGASLVFGAGNGYLQQGGYSSFLLYPASYNNVISVTGIGHLTNLGQPLNQPGHPYDGQVFSNKDVHEMLSTGNPSDSLMTSQHNEMVDICAPAYGVNTITRYQPGMVPSDYCQYNTGIGVSFATPLVSGTMGLIASFKPQLSPYQREVALKMGVDSSIYTIGTNYRYQGKLGVGSLRADKALTAARNIFPNDPNLQTLVIESVNITHLCYDSGTTVVRPQLSVKLTGGNGHYRYDWFGIGMPSTFFNMMGRPGDNTVILNDTTSPTPTIADMKGTTKIFHYLLRVTDSSATPKVALKEVFFTLRTYPSPSDLAMRDSYYDMLDEPNTQYNTITNNYDIWHSPDLWVRDSADYKTTPKNPEYFTDSPNYIYVRVRNVGCAASVQDATALHLYWTLGSTGERWKNDWDGTTVVPSNGGAGLPATLPAGGEITTGAVQPPVIPALQIGDSAIIMVPWHPVNPRDYKGSPQNFDACILARLLETSKTNFGFYKYDSLITRTATNVNNNNNVVTRNLTIVNLGRRCSGCRSMGDPATSTHRVYVANAEDHDQVFALEMLTQKDIKRHLSGNISEYASVTLALGDLYDRWQNAGGAGHYASKDDQARTVTYNPAKPLLLEGINLHAGEHFPVDVTFSLRSDATEIPYAVNDFKVFFRQLINEGKGNAVYGAMVYSVNIAAYSSTSANKQSTGVSGAQAQVAYMYSVSPNPVSGTLNIRYSGPDKTTANVLITDINGKVVLRKNNLTVQDGGAYPLKLATLPAGMYMVRITDSKGTDETHKVTKQ